MVEVQSHRRRYSKRYSGLRSPDDSFEVRSHERKIRVSKHYIRERVQPPSEFGKLRTKSIDSHKLVVGRKKGSAKTEVQAILHPRTTAEARKLGYKKIGDIPED